MYLREWLEYRALTAEQLAGRLETSKSVVSKLLNGKQRYNQDWLERFAYALNCEVPDLYRDPTTPTHDDLLSRATPEQMKQIIDFAEYLINKTGTENR
ncbi:MULTISPECIES: helix-turn-helix domain-containing protein [Alphaproteobacteria]|uniref:helix-turn-helix domain-containing protein n=1 Tax=Alphaproteobacteria TaxID=28211 RepID=UPI003A94F4D3